MKRATRFPCVVALLVCVTAIAGAIDFGLAIDNSTAVSAQQETTLVQADRLSLWLSSPLGKYWAFRIRGFGSFTYDTEVALKADIEQFELAARIPAEVAGASLFTMKLGRFRLSDFSSRVVSHTADGISFGASYPAADLTFAIGYTGLLLNQSSRIFLSKADNFDTAAGQTLAAPRAIALLTMRFPELVLRQDVTLSMVAQEDLRPILEANMPQEDRRIIPEGTTTIDPVRGGAVDTQYVGLGISGPIVAPIYYSGVFYLGTGRTLAYLDDVESPTGSSYQYTPILSYLAAGGVKAFIESFLFSRLALDVLYASGDADATSLIEGNSAGDYGGFVSLTGTASSLAFVPTLSNILLAKASYSARPFSFLRGSALSRLQAGVSGFVFFRPTIGPISPAGLVQGGVSAFDYLGAEIDATVNFRPFSDLGFAVRGGVFLPSNATGIFETEYQNPKMVGSFEFSLSM